MRLADCEAKTMRLYWPLTDIGGPFPHFFELFEAPEIEQVDLDEIQGDWHDNWRLWVSEEDISENWAQAYPAQQVQGRAIDFEFDRIPITIRNILIGAKYILHYDNGWCTLDA